MIERSPAWLTRAGAMVVTVLVTAAVTPLARAAEHVMRLVTESEQGRFLFEPSLLVIDPGDTVTFVPESRMHGVKSVAGMLPEGATPWRGRMGEQISVQLDQPGVYGVKCPAGYDVGMVGLIVVGNDPPANWQSARAVRHPPAASTAFDELFAAAACRLKLGAAAGCATN